MVAFTPPLFCTQALSIDTFSSQKRFGSLPGGAQLTAVLHARTAHRERRCYPVFLS